MSKLIEDTKEILSSLEGYHQLCKMLHWSSTHHSEHVLLDEIDHDVLDFQDRIAEEVMGYTNSRFGIGDLKTLLPSSKSFENMLKELKNDISKYRKNFEDNNGLVNILDDFTEEINKWNYLRTLI